MYYIIEIQETNKVPAMLTNTAATKNEALSKYHTVLSFAAISQVEFHSCVILDEQGRQIARECFNHVQEVIEDAETEGAVG